MPPGRIASLPAVKYQRVALGGGWDQITPTYELPPGVAREVSNYEVGTRGGYSRIKGYERYDGQAKPSDATYDIIQVASFTNVPTAPANIKKVGAATPSARLVAVNETDLTMAITNTSGSFTAGTAMEVDGGAAIGTLVSGTQRVTAQENAQYLNLAADYYRGLIGTVGTTATGATGAVLGVASLVVNCSTVAFTAGGSGTPSIGDTLTKGSAVATILRIDLTGGAWADSDAAGNFLITNPANNYTSGAGTAGSVGVTISGAQTKTNSDNVFAFRKDDGGNTVNIYTASSTGWDEIPMYKEVTFSAAGSGTPAEGDTLTQGSVTSTIKRILLESGTFSASSAAGRFIITTPSGGSGNYTAASATAGSVGCTLAGAQAAISLTYDSTADPSQRYSFVTANFVGSTISQRLYGADGVNRCFEFDGLILAPIDTKLTTDTPRYVESFENHLFASCDSSVVFSGPAKPYAFNTTDGGGEIVIGDDVTGMTVQPGAAASGAMTVFGRNNLQVLYGTSKDDFNLQRFISFTGARHYSAETMSQTYFLDDRGVMSLETSMKYGNFEDATYTHSIQRFIDSHRDLVNSSLINRAKSQYRVLFSDGSALYSTIVNGQYLGSTKAQYDDKMFCAFAGELANGNEVIYYGAEESGYVYQADTGTSFDGEPIEAYIHLVWDPMGSPSIIKRYRKGSVELESESYVALGASYKLGWGNNMYVQPTSTPRTYELGFTGIETWDSFTWDEFTWDEEGLGEIAIDIAGSGNNIMLELNSGTDYMDSYTINGLILHYSMRRGVR